MKRQQSILILVMMIAGSMGPKLCAATPTPVATQFPVTMTPVTTATAAPTESASVTPTAHMGTPAATTTPCSRPEAPVLLHPANDARFDLESEPPVLDWIGAGDFQLEIGIDPDFSESPALLEVNASQLDLATLIPSHVWRELAFTAYWRVRIPGPAGCEGYWSVAWHFSKTTISAPALLWPEQDARFSPTDVPAYFSWTRVDASSGYYTMEIGMDPSWNTSLGSAMIDGTDLDLEGNVSQEDWAALYGTYYWRIAAFDEANNPGPWSATRYFSRANLPGPVTLTPYDREHMPARSAPPLFSWECISSAAGYQLQFATDTGFREILATIDLDDSQWDTAPLIPDLIEWYRAHGEFAWRAAAVDENGLHCPWGPGSSFTKNGRLRVIAYGDSITYGDCYEEGPGYLGFVEDMLIDRYGFAEVINEGNPGAKTYHGKINVEDVLERNNGEYMLIMFGTNDTVDPYGCTHWGEEYGCDVDGNLYEVVTAALAYNTIPLLATIIPTNPDGQWSDPWRLLENNEKIRAMASQVAGVRLVEMYGHFMSYGDIVPLFCDSLHLNRDGYEWMAYGWYPYLLD
ncbi:SGNH/GDSL hydrolase family protein [bacterium]|nr:SGNH/GDSL hydrolase family protein [candidate division CSSED10-310 bacterium]